MITVSAPRFIATDWGTASVTSSWTTNTSLTCLVRRIGDTAEFQIKAALTGAPNSATLTFGLPSGYTINTSKLLASTGTGTSPVLSLVSSGLCAGNITGFNTSYDSTTTVRAKYWNFGGVTSQTSGVTQANPGIFANNDYVLLMFSVPIVGWSAYGP